MRQPTTEFLAPRATETLATALRAPMTLGTSMRAYTKPQRWEVYVDGVVTFELTVVS